MFNELGPSALVGPTGQEARLLIRIASQQAQVMVRMSSELGFSPSSRGRVTVDPRPAQANPFDEFS